jgi:hypothetical protein
MGKNFYFSFNLNITQRLTAGLEKQNFNHYYYWWGSSFLSNFSPALRKKWNVNLVAVGPR